MKKLMFVVVASLVCVWFVGQQAECASLEKGMVTFTWSVRDNSIVPYARLLGKSRLATTVYVFPDTLSDGAHPTWDQMLRFYDTYGWETGDNGFREDHFIDLSEDQILEKLNLSQAAFVAHGLDYVSAFAPPFGEGNAAIRRALLREGHFTSLRNVKTADGPPYNTVENFDPWSVCVVDLRNFSTFKDIKPVIDRAVSDKVWLVFCIQGMAKTYTDDDTAVVAKEFKKLVNYVSNLAKKHQINSVTVSGGVEIMQTVQAAGL